jgi:hypothetical protein
LRAVTLWPVSLRAISTFLRGNALCRITLWLFSLRALRPWWAVSLRAVIALRARAIILPLLAVALLLLWPWGSCLPFCRVCAYCAVCSLRLVRVSIGVRPVILLPVIILLWPVTLLITSLLSWFIFTGRARAVLPLLWLAILRFPILVRAVALLVSPCVWGFTATA